jgi:hypothetical protein
MVESIVLQAFLGHVLGACGGRGERPLLLLCLEPWYDIAWTYLVAVPTSSETNMPIQEQSNNDASDARYD